MNALGVLAHLAADHTLRERMVGVAGDGRETAVLDGDEEAAARRTVVRTDGQHAAFKGIMTPAMLGWVARLNPFKTPDTQRLAVLFGIVYFAQGMWYLPNQTITIVLKERGLSAGQVATFFSITTVPWLIKPVYGLVSDLCPSGGAGARATSCSPPPWPPAPAPCWPWPTITATGAWRSSSRGWGWASRSPTSSWTR